MNWMEEFPDDFIGFLVKDCARVSLPIQQEVKR